MIESARDTTTDARPARCALCGSAEFETLRAGLEACSSCGGFRPLPIDYRTLPVAGTVRLQAASTGVLRGKYRLITRLGEGAHGITYLAEHEFIRNPCVIKILPYRVGDASDPGVARLRREARAGYLVHDPFVIRVLDVDHVEGTWFFVMEFVPGIDLGALVATRRCMPWQQAAGVARDAARGLAAIHQHGLVHRDVKPSNLMLDLEGRVRVADLGVATLAEARGTGRATEYTSLGTMAYTAPELFQGAQDVKPTADLYALGVTLFQLLTGRLPHASKHVFQRLIDLQCRPASWPTDVATDVPDWLRDIVLQLLAVEPADRPSSAEQLAEHLAAHAPARAEGAPTSTIDTLEPRGIGVVPLVVGGARDDEWLGYAVATGLARRLAAVSGLYVADTDALAATLERLATGDWRGDRERLLAAGRLVGAATIVTGRVTRRAQVLNIAVQVVLAGAHATEPTIEVEGPLTDLAAIEAELFERLTRRLNLTAGDVRAVAALRTAPLPAREALILARQAYLKGDYEGGIGLAQEALTLDPEFAEALGCIGICNARLGRYDEAAAQHLRQEEAARQWGDARLQIEAWANLGAMNYFRGVYEEAQTHFARAARMARDIGLKVEGAQIFNNLGFVLFRLGRLAEAEEAFLAAIDTHRAYGGLTSLVGPYNGVGNVLVEQGRYAEARDYYRRALALADEIGDRVSVATTRLHLGRAAALEKKVAEAQLEFTIALGALEETGFWSGLARAYEYIADLNIGLGDAEDALRCIERRIQLARQHKNPKTEAAAWQQRAGALERAGRMAEALESRARAEALSTETQAGA